MGRVDRTLAQRSRCFHLKAACTALWLVVAWLGTSCGGGNPSVPVATKFDLRFRGSPEEALVKIRDSVKSALEASELCEPGYPRFAAWPPSKPGVVAYAELTDSTGPEARVILLNSSGTVITFTPLEREDSRGWSFTVYLIRFLPSRFLPMQTKESLPRVGVIIGMGPASYAFSPQAREAYRNIEAAFLEGLREAGVRLN